ncbi:MAG TPA: helix-turn-helix domain-containing protein [Puia sp.]|jgi:antitoxin component HigA of HigAB toxin-antitoxin module|nr:helix-turn-helix domain-containing protein [Puia sp.]
MVKNNMVKKITTRQQYHSAMADIEGYLQKGFSNLTTTEEDHLEELSKAVEAWELKEFPMPMQPSFPDILIYIMQFKRYTQSELSEDLSISKSLLSEILNGKKQPNLSIVVNLHKKFGIDANVLLESVSG